MDDELIEKLKELTELLENKQTNKLGDNNIAPVRIVVLQRGWVVVGRYFQSGHKCYLENGYVIRRWGTTEGLGELALKGPLAETKLEKTPTIGFHELTIVQTIDCAERKWLSHCPVV